MPTSRMAAATSTANQNRLGSFAERALARSKAAPHHGLLHQVLADARVRDPDAHRDRPQRGQDGNRTGPAGQKTQADR